MQEQLNQIFGYLWGVWRYRWLALACAWVLSLAGWAFVYKLPDAYVATARIYVDSNTVLAPLLQGLAIQPDIEQRINLMSRTLLSRPNLEKMMRMADLDLQVRDEIENERFLDQLRNRVKLVGERGNTSLYSVSFQDTDRDTAKRIVQALITVFIESTLGDKREDSTDAQSFLDQQIAAYEVRLIEAEERLAKFKQRYAGTLPGDEGGYYGSLKTAKAQLRDAELQLSEASNRSDELRRQLAGEEPMMRSNALSGNQISTPLDARIQSLQVQLDSLLARYTEKHPEVRQIRSLVETLEAERAEQIEAALADGSLNSYAGVANSPVYEQMRSLLVASDAEVASLQTRVDEFRRRVVDLEEKVNNIPAIEAELKQLDRDYGVVLKQHSAMLARREAAMISQQVEQNANDVTFRVVDPPFVPLLPSEPNKLMLNAAVLFGAIGAGIGIALLFSMFRPVIIDQLSLTQLSGLPVFGCVSIILSPQQRRRKLFGQAVFYSVFLLLVCGFVGVAYFEQQMLSPL